MGKLILWHEALEQSSTDMVSMASAMTDSQGPRFICQTPSDIKREVYWLYCPCLADIKGYTGFETHSTRKPQHKR